jgi:hypothetical protein
MPPPISGDGFGQPLQIEGPLELAQLVQQRLKALKPNDTQRIRPKVTDLLLNPGDLVGLSGEGSLVRSNRLLN